MAIIMTTDPYDPIVGVRSSAVFCYCLLLMNLLVRSHVLLRVP